MHRSAAFQAAALVTTAGYLSCLSSVALAAELTDRGRDLANDPYENNSALTTGRIAGFRSLYGDPDALAGALTPASPAAGRADLLLVNERSSWAEVVVGGQKLGVLGPYGEGLIKDVPAGEYAFTLTLPTGYTAKYTARTVEAPAVVPIDHPALQQDDPRPEQPPAPAPTP